MYILMFLTCLICYMWFLTYDIWKHTQLGSFTYSESPPKAYLNDKKAPTNGIIMGAQISHQFSQSRLFCAQKSAQKRHKAAAQLGRFCRYRCRGHSLASPSFPWLPLGCILCSIHGYMPVECVRAIYSPKHRGNWLHQYIYIIIAHFQG